MDIIVNGEPCAVEPEMNIHQLLTHLGYRDRFVAVAKNKTCIPKSAYSETLVSEADEIEILAPMSGG